MSDYEKLMESIIEGDEEQAVDVTRKLVESGHPALDILQHGMIPAMDRLGEKLVKEECYIPELLLSSRAMQAAVTEIRSILTEDGAEETRRGTIVVGTVRGDIHTIGKNLVSVVLRSAGFQVIDLGVNVGEQEFAEAVRENNAVAVAMSAMLTTSMNSMKKIVRSLQKEDFGGEVRIFIGGAPITPLFARELGVQYADNILETVRLALNAAEEKNSGKSSG